MKEYVCGFLINTSANEVALILKNRPEWQKGLLNGVGGHIEYGEKPKDAMKREFWEEAGAEINDWIKFTELTDHRNWKVHFFYCKVEFEVARVVHSKTDEEVIFVDLNHIRDEETIPNLQWLIPMALSMDLERCRKFIITEFIEESKS